MLTTGRDRGHAETAHGVGGGGYGTHPLLDRLSTRFGLSPRLLRALYPPMPTLNTIPGPILDQIRSAIFGSDRIVLNMGSGGLTGCGRRLWQGPIDPTCQIVHADLTTTSQTRVVADAHALPFGDATVDAVVLQAVLEHVVDPRMVIAEAERVLRPGGVFYLEVPFLQGFHADPHDYQRYTLPGLRARLAQFEELQSGVSVGPFCSLVWLIRDGVSSCFRNPMLYAGARFLAGWVLSPLRYLDYLARGNYSAERLANEYYFLCRKKPRIS